MSHDIGNSRQWPPNRKQKHPPSQYLYTNESAKVNYVFDDGHLIKTNSFCEPRQETAGIQEVFTFLWRFKKPVNGLTFANLKAFIQTARVQYAGRRTSTCVNARQGP